MLPSGIFYGNNVPACLAIINKRKPAARKGRVLMPAMKKFVETLGTDLSMS